MPIDFRPSWLDRDLEAYSETVQRFLDTEMAPADAAARERGHVGHALWRRAGELGLLLADIPEPYGGGGGDFRHVAILYDQMARRGLTGMNPSVHSIVAHYFFNHGTEAQKAKYLPLLARGELVGAIAMTEPGAGSDLQGVRTRAERRSDGYVINGSKTFISNGYLAGVVLVVAKTDPAQRAKGTSILIVETEGCTGYRVGRVLDKIGLKAQDTSELFFDDVVVPADHVLGGAEGRGFAQLMSDLPYERTIIGVLAAAAMEGAYEATLAYVRERHAFGRPLAEFQNTKFKLAEIATITKAARVFVDHCVERLVTGTLDTATASMIKLWSSEQQAKVVDECLQLFGGYGYMNEYLIGRLYVDARIQRIYGGTSEVMKEVIRGRCDVKRRRDTHDKAEAMQHEFLDVTVADGIAWVTLNRPERLNALNAGLVRELHEFFAGLDARSAARVVVLRGAGRAFCAGYDLKDAQVEGKSVSEMLEVQHSIRNIMVAMRRCPQPIIAIVQGAASGGGFALALAADVRLATPDARMNAAFIRIGLSGCDMGVSYFLPRMVGSSVASLHLLTGRFIDAARAQALGLVSSVAEPDALETEARALAADMLAATPLGLRLTKEALGHAVDGNSMDAVMAMEDRNQILCTRGEDFAEGIAAFLEKRAPRYGAG